LETELHTNLQLGRCGPIVTLTLDAQPRPSQLLKHQDDPLLVALSTDPLDGDGEVPGKCKLWSSIAWDGEFGVARLLFPASAVKDLGNCYVTLCAPGSNGLETVGVSKVISSLPAQRHTQLPPPWRALIRDGHGRVAARTHSGVTLVDQAVLPGRLVWHSEVTEYQSFVSVDLLALKPLHDEAQVKVTLSRNALVVRIGVEGEANETFTVSGLPDGLAEGNPARIRICRSLGLICCELARAARSRSP
jgi:hypothetical protein